MALRKEPASNRYCFDDVVINCQDFSVIKGAQKKTLTPRAFDVLRYLIEHSPRVVEKSELFEQVWKEKFVTDNALTRTVTDIRHVLGDKADSPRYIQTVPKRGYCFRANVNATQHLEAIAVEEKQKASLTEPEPALPDAIASNRPAGFVSKNHLPRAISRRTLNSAALVAFVLAVAVVGAYHLATRGAAIDSLAVIPFGTKVGDAEVEYLADGLSENLVSTLSQLPTLKVMSRNSVLRYKGKEIDPRTVGRELGVRAVLLGRLETHGENLSISLELVDTRDNRQLWGEQYDRKFSDLVQLQADISRVVSERLLLRLTGEEQKLLANRHTENSEAYNLYLKGRYHLDKRTGRDAEKSNEYFQQVVTLDPYYALAYAGLADSYFALGSVGNHSPKQVMPKAKAAAERALQLDESLAEAHASFGWLLMFYDYDWIGAEREFKRALELNPDSAIAHQYYATCLASLGRFDEALSESRRAIEIDPLSLFISRTAGTVLYYARQYDQAIEQFQKTTDLDPNFRQVYGWLVRVYEAKGFLSEAVEVDLMERDIAGGRIEVPTAALKKAYASAGWKGYWQTVLQKEIGEANSNYDPYSIAVIYTRLGQKKLALQWLEKAYDERICHMISIAVDPEFDILRSEPRFWELQKRLGLAQ